MYVNCLVDVSYTYNYICWYTWTVSLTCRILTTVFVDVRELSRWRVVYLQLYLLMYVNCLVDVSSAYNCICWCRWTVSLTCRILTTVFVDVGELSRWRVVYLQLYLLMYVNCLVDVSYTYNCICWCTWTVSLTCRILTTVFVDVRELSRWRVVYLQLYLLM